MSKEQNLPSTHSATFSAGFLAGRSHSSSLAGVREAVGDPHGKLMHDELLERVASIMRVHAASLEWLDAREAHRHCGGNEVTKSQAAYIAAQRRLQQAIEGAG